MAELENPGEAAVRPRGGADADGGLGAVLWGGDCVLSGAAEVVSEARGAKNAGEERGGEGGGKGVLWQLTSQCTRTIGAFISAQEMVVERQ